MSKQITMRRNLFVAGQPRTAGATYFEEDETAVDLITRGWAVPGPVYGAQMSAVLAAPARASGNPTLAVWSNEYGAQVLQFAPLALAAGDVVLVAWSTNQGDGTALGLALDAVADDLELASPVGAFASNLRILTAASQWGAAVWDGQATIKSLAAVVCKLGAATGATAQHLILDITP